MKRYIIIVMLLFMFSFVSSAIVNNSYDLTISCNSYDCTQLNISILFPNSTSYVINGSMTNQISHANYTLLPSVIGEYKYYLFDGSTYGSGTLDVTKRGEDLSTAQAILYFLFLISAIALLITTIYWAIKIKWTHGRNEDEEIVSVNDLRFLKIFLIPISYVLLMWISGILYSIFDNYLILNGASSVFNWLYWIMLSFLWPLIILSFLFALILFINDKKLARAIEKFDFQ